MAGPRYIADPEDAVRTVALDGLSVLFHAPSGMTHIVAAPAPEILERAAAQARPTPPNCSARLARALRLRRRRGGGRDRRPARRARGGGAGAPRMKHSLALQIGPVAFRIGSRLARRRSTRSPALYAAYPAPRDGICDFTVRLEPEKPWRRWIRPSVAIRGDYVLPDAAPMSLAHGLLAAEMGMNLQMALGQKRYLLLHASIVEKDGRALIMTGESGRRQIDPGGPARRARLAADGRRIRPARPGRAASCCPFPRAISLKNGAIRVMEAEVAADRFGPRLEGTPKGVIRHLRPNDEALGADGARARGRR